MTDAPINPFEIVEAEVLGVPMKEPVHLEAAYGAALLARIGAGKA